MLKKAMGCFPSLPDVRDFTVDHEEIAKYSLMMQQKVQALGVTSSVDLRQWCSPIEDQGQLGSCTANAGVGLVEYYEKKTFGKYLNASRLFLYKVTRNLMKETGDSGADLKTVMQALVMFGVCLEDYWPYTDGDGFDVEPSPFTYAMASNYTTQKYFRFDPPTKSKTQVLSDIKSYLVNIPYPQKGEKVAGGHAMMIVGYDDNHTIGAYKGAFLIRNSWGTSWGVQGYGWLPYQYALSGLAWDFWALISEQWIDTGTFV